MFFRLGAAALLFAAVCLLLPGTVFAEDPEIEEAIEDLIDTVDMTEATEDIRFGSLPDGGLRFFGVPPDAYAQTDPSKSGAVEKAVTFLLDHAVAFGVKSLSVGFDLTKDRTVDTRQYLRFQQTYEDIPVFGGEAIVQMNEDANVTAVIPSLMTNTADLDAMGNEAITPELTTTEAESIAVEASVTNYEQLAAAEGITLTEQQLDEYRNSLAIAEDTVLSVYDPAIMECGSGPSLTYKVTIGGEGNPDTAEIILVDALTGDLIFGHSLVCSALDRRIRDQENNWLLWPVAWMIREEGDPPAEEPERREVNRAYEFLADVFEFYSIKHGRDSVDGEGMPLRATVRYCPTFLMAIDKADCPYSNAGWNGLLHRMNIGDGLTFDDTLAHEFTHGVTNDESQLTNLGQSGAIAESLSDIWGEFTDQTNGWLINDPPDTIENNWLIGEDLPGGAFRSLKDPTIYGDPDRAGSDMFLPPPYNPLGVFDFSYDNGGVHTNCGVNNKLCYLLTDGDTFNGRTITGMGMDAVLTLFYEMQCNLLTSNANYTTLYYALGQAAVNKEFSAEQRANIEEACRAVEIRPTTFVDINGNTGNPLIQFTDGGDLIMHGGQIHEEADIEVPVDPILVIKRYGWDPLALANLVTGDLYLKGKKYELAYTAACLGSNSLVVRNQKDMAVAVINSADIFVWSLGYVPAGSLILAGRIIYPNPSS